jgi:hypothetical protein
VTLPSLEKMHASWEKARYKSFVLALSAGMAKLDEYYQQSAESDVHIMAMGVYPSSQLGDFLLTLVS